MPASTIKLFQIIIMAAPGEAQQLTKTFKETNYFGVGTYKRQFVELMSSGFLANLVATTVLAPLERWKIIKQTQMSYDYRPKDKMTSFLNFLSKTTSQQGFKSMWRGNAAHLWMQGWQVAAQIFLFDTIKSTFSEIAFEMQNEPISKFLLQRIAAPLLASASSLVFTHPIDTARVRLAMNYYRNPSEMHFHGILTCWGMIKLQNGGSNRVLYRGYLLANLIALLHINIYATVRDIWSRNKVDMGEYGDLFASKEMVGMLASMMLLHPLDTIKKNLQLNNMDKSDQSVRNNNVRKVFRSFTQRYGLSQLYQGMTVTVARQVLFCPLFLYLLGPIQQNLKIF